MTMYLEHFGLREAPFRITPHTEFFFSGANRGATLEALVYAITAGEGLVKVTGEVGTGKTMLCRVLMERLPETVVIIYLAVPSLSRDEMLLAIAAELGIDTQGASTTQLLRGLQANLVERHAQGKQVVALIDEAHAMPLPTLEEIRLLSNLETGTQKLLQIVLFGQPELDEHLNLANMRQLKERITHAFSLAPMPPRDIKDYIHFRLRAAGYHGPDLFGPEVLRIIADASEGLTRRINIYADKTLLAAFAAGTHSVSADHARAAVTDTQIVVAPKPSRYRVALAAVAGILAGAVLGFAASQWWSAAPPAGARPMASGAVAPAPAAPASPSTPASAASAGAPASGVTAAAAPPAEPPASPVPAVSPAPEAASATASPSPAAATPSPVAPAEPSKPVAASAPAEPAKQAAPAKPAPTVAQAVSVPAPPPAETKPPAPAVSRRVASATIEPRTKAGLALLGEPGNAGYAVQLIMTDARDPAYLEYFLSAVLRSVKEEALYLYPSGSAEAPKVGVLYGVFASRKDASAALEELPASLRQFRPYVRDMASIRSDVRNPS